MFDTLSIEEATERLIDYRGKTPPKTTSGVRLITAKVIKQGTILDDPKEYIADDYYDEWMRRGLPEQGDVLITTEAPLGEVARLNSQERIALAQRVILLRARKKVVDPGFLFYALQSDYAQGELAARATGTTVAGIKQSELRKIRIPTFPLPTQRRIAGVLSAYDELIANNQRRIAILEEMARALYREWFVYFRFPAEGSAKAGAPGVVLGGGELPEGWEVKELQHFGRVITGKTPSKANADYYGDDIPFVKTPDMHGNMFILDTGEKLSSHGANSQANKTLPKGTICVSCIGTIGVVSITTEYCQTNQQINSVALTNEHSREFLFFLLQDAKQTLENLGANGATMGNVNKSKFESMAVLCPQNDILHRFHCIVEPMFDQILGLLRVNQNLRRTRDLLLPRLMSGRVELNTIDA
jgi:type I restriction enzyme S subunit